MKKIRILIIMLIFLLTACSKVESIELISAKVDIVTDKTKTGSLVIFDENKESEIIPTSLYYEFEIKNKGKKIDTFDAIQFKIEPYSELSGEVQKVIGKNIFSQKGIGSGWGLPPMPFKMNESATTTVYYNLGTYEGNSKIPTFPSSEKLMSIKNSGLNADLVLFFKSKEVARFDLSEHKENDF